VSCRSALRRLWRLCPSYPFPFALSGSGFFSIAISWSDQIGRSNLTQRTFFTRNRLNVCSAGNHTLGNIGYISVLERICVMPGTSFHALLMWGVDQGTDALTLARVVLQICRSPGSTEETLGCYQAPDMQEADFTRLMPLIQRNFLHMVRELWHRRAALIRPLRRPSLRSSTHSASTHSLRFSTPAPLANPSDPFTPSGRHVDIAGPRDI